MLRAVRLVVDTGIHDKNWSRQQVIDYMHANDVNDALAQTEADRYIAWPGQALAYKMGQLTILKLRDDAKTQLGEWSWWDQRHRTRRDREIARVDGNAAR